MCCFWSTYDLEKAKSRANHLFPNCRWMQHKTKLHEDQTYDTMLCLYYTVTVLGKSAVNCRKDTYHTWITEKKLKKKKKKRKKLQYIINYSVGKVCNAGQK